MPTVTARVATERVDGTQYIRAITLGTAHISPELLDLDKC
jgi:hypothetical protein